MGKRFEVVVRSVGEAEEGRTGHILGVRSLVSSGEEARKWARLVVVEDMLEISALYFWARQKLLYHSHYLSEELVCMSASVSGPPSFRFLRG